MDPNSWNIFFQNRLLKKILSVYVSFHFICKGMVSQIKSIFLYSCQSIPATIIAIRFHWSFNPSLTWF